MLNRFVQFCRECIESAAARGRYWTGSILLALLGGYLLVVTQAFSDETARWLGLGGGAAALALSALLFRTALDRKGIELLLPPAAGVLIGGWTVVATSGVYSDSTASSLAFASGWALLAVAIVGLGLHEVRTERVVHALDVGQPADERVETAREGVETAREREHAR